MKTFKADDLTLTIPTSWDEVTLDQYTKLYQAMTDDLTVDMVISILSNLSADELRKTTAYDLDYVLAEHIDFIYNEKIVIPEGKPERLTIGGRSISVPDNTMQASATYGQIVDIRHVIQVFQDKGSTPNSLELAEDLLTIFLWPYLTDEPYQDRHHAKRYWNEIKQVNCIDALRLSAFFLSNFSKLQSSGRIKEVKSQKTRRIRPLFRGWLASLTLKFTLPRNS